jgi:integral membrane protein
MRKLFSYTAILEGTSLLLLFFIAMPMKYFFYNPVLIRPVGMAHGILFVAYCVIATYLKFKSNWNWTDYTIICLASFVPFGTFYVEKKYIRYA